MATTVEIGVTRGFVLDSPVQGVLGENRLGGLNFVDVSDRVASVSIARGKNRDLERYSAGSLDVSFHNEDRFFDPTPETTIDLVPRVPIRVSMDGGLQFVGSVNDWKFDYSTAGKSNAVVTAADDLQLLAQRNVADGGTAVEQLTGARIEAVLDQLSVDWPVDKRDIDAGGVTVLEQAFEGEGALEYLQLVEATERGQLFIAKDGRLTFKDEDSGAARSDSLVTFADDGSGVGFQAAAIDFGSELLVNRAVFESAVGSATAVDDLSQLNFGIIEQEFSVLNTSQDELQALADYVVARFANPELRFSTISVNLDSLSPADRAAVLGLEISDVALIRFTPNGTGDPIEKFGQVIKISHSQSPGRHDMQFGFDSLDFAPLVLDDAVFGKLDFSRLGY
jgi:hypothetical protein